MAAVLEKVGLANRAMLAAADASALACLAAEEDDMNGSKPCAVDHIEEISRWISQAQRKELSDIMAEIFGGADAFLALKADLSCVGVSAPRDLLERSPAELRRLLALRCGIAPLQEGVVEAWQDRAKNALGERPWLALWGFAM
jgi:hypothetical protein